METQTFDRCVCGPLDQQNSIVQYFKATDNFISGIAIKFGTYRKIMKHRLEFRLHLLDDVHGLEQYDLASEPFFRKEANAAGISDVGYFHFYFPTIPNSKGRLFALTIASPDAVQGQAVTAWLARNQFRIPGHIRCLMALNVGEEFGLQAKLIISNPIVKTESPQGIVYSPLSSCNMNCIHCISRHSRRRAIKMSEHIKQDIKTLADSKKLQWIFTDYSGDIFFAEHKYPGQLDFLFSLGITLHVDTNGAYLNDAVIERVMASPIDTLNISVDAARDETYQTIWIGAPAIEYIFDSACAAVEARKRYGREDNLRINMSFVMMMSNLHELPLFIQRAAKIGVNRVICLHLEVYHADMESESLFNDKAYYNSIRAACIELAKSVSIKLDIPEELLDCPDEGGREPCLTPWNSMVVLANGDVMACCVPQSKMGNLHEQPLDKIWLGLAYQRLRARVNSINPPSLCKSCPRRNSLNSSNTHSTFSLGRKAIPLLDELMA